MVDTLYDGRRFRTLNIIDESNREGLAIEIGTTLPSLRVIAVLEELVALHGEPQSLRVDNGPELTSLALTVWCEARVDDGGFYTACPSRRSHAALAAATFFG